MKQENENTFTHLGLFEGIGGFSLAARWMGFETLAYCEWDKKCQVKLKKKFPNADSLLDITKTDFKPYANRIDIITGGFPCQPYSLAGKQLGKEDERHLWPEMLRAVKEVQPSWVVGENVYGLVNWSGGLVFDEVQTDLENEGYEVQAYVLPACAVNAPHKRDRVWFVAYSDSNRKMVQRRNRNNNYKERNEKKEVQERKNEFIGFEQPSSKIITNTNRQQECWPKWFTSREFAQYYGITSEPGVRRGNDGFPGRVDRLKQLGNAIVPQVALQIFKSIEQYENETPT